MLEKLEKSLASRKAKADCRFALLDKGNYGLYEIKKGNWMPTVEQDGNARMAFVDGGNSLIVKTPTAELHRIRTATVFTQGKKMAKATQKKGYLLVTASVDNGAVSYAAEFFDSTLDGETRFELDGLPENIETALGRVAGIARRLCELAAAKRAATELENGCHVIIDGTLEAPTEPEKKEMQGLTLTATERGINAGSVAKTCSILTDNGQGLIEATEALAGKGTGYMPVAKGNPEKHDATVAVARLNAASKYLFRVDAPQGSLKNMVQALISESNDLAFPGYPYGLIMADMLARVSNAELDLTKARVMASAAPDSELRRLMAQARSLDAHSVLDRMQF